MYKNFYIVLFFIGTGHLLLGNAFFRGVIYFISVTKKGHAFLCLILSIPLLYVHMNNEGLSRGQKNS